MKMRTAYFKVPEMQKALSFWEGFLGITAHKKSPYWCELRCENINFGLLWMEDFLVQKDQSNFTPVFEVTAEELDGTKTRAIQNGAKVVVDISEHPDKMSYVLSDPFGNEFELTRFRD